MILSQLTTNIAKVLEYRHYDENGDLRVTSINITVRRKPFRDAATREFQERLAKLDEDASGLTDALPEFIADWDLFTDEARTSKVAITPENIETLPFDFVVQLAQCVFETLRIDPKAKPANSDDSSEQKVRPASHAVN